MGKRKYEAERAALVSKRNKEIEEAKITASKNAKKVLNEKPVKVLKGNGELVRTIKNIEVKQKDKKKDEKN